jgi:hypothetical protein
MTIPQYIYIKIPLHPHGDFTDNSAGSRLQVHMPIPLAANSELGGATSNVFMRCKRSKKV